MCNAGRGITEPGEHVLHEQRAAVPDAHAPAGRGAARRPAAGHGQQLRPAARDAAARRQGAAAARACHRSPAARQGFAQGLQKVLLPGRPNSCIYDALSFI